MKGLFDINLDFPLEDARWREYCEAANCAVSCTADLDLLTDTLLQHHVDFSYLPSANCFFLRHDPVWHGLASALSPRTGTPSQNSVLVVKASSRANGWQDLRGARLGYINTYCTTSYFAPAILLAREGLSLGSFFQAGPVAPWQGQIDAVIDGSIDATTVYEDVWLARPANAARTRVIARIDDLPTPVVVARSTLGDLAPKLKTALFAVQAPIGTSALYAGFASYQDARMRRFFAAIESIPAPAFADCAREHAATTEPVR